VARKDWLGRKSAEADKALFRRKRTGGFGAIRREKQTSPPSRCWACASARASEESSTGASSGSLRRPVAFNSLSICNARRHAVCSPSMSWVNSKASSNAGENLRSIPWRRTMPWKRSLRLPVTHSPILSKQATSSSRETAAKSRARSSSSEMASSSMILPRDLKAVNETWMACRWLQSCSSSSFWAWVCARVSSLSNISTT
jgi:hypothetical protein